MINLLTGIDSTAAALNAERFRMDIVSQNISNANVEHALDGKPYQRQQVIFESVMRQAQDDEGGISTGPQSVAVARVETDHRPPRMVWDPATQTARATPDINVPLEMVDLMAASRAFEANLAVVKTARMMAMQTLQIGKR